MPAARKAKVNISLTKDSVSEKSNDEQIKAKESVCDREKASFIQKLFYSYAKPVYDMQASNDPITLERYPKLSDRVGMKVNADKIESFIKKQIEENPNDPYAVMKAVFYANKKEYMMFVAVRIFNKFIEIFNAMVYLEIFRQFETTEGPFS